MIGRLTHTEQVVADCARDGVVFDPSKLGEHGQGDPRQGPPEPASPEPDPSTSGDRDPRRPLIRPSVRPAVLEALLKGRLTGVPSLPVTGAAGDAHQASRTRTWTTHPRGVFLKDVTITGDLSLTFHTGLLPLRLDGCVLGEIDLSSAGIAAVVLRNCAARALRADWATIAHLTAETCAVRESVTISDAEIGTLSLRGTRIGPAPGGNSPDDHGAEYGVDARRLRCVGEVLLNPDPLTGRPFTTVRPMVFTDARVGHVGTRDAVVDGVDGQGNSIVGERMEVAGSLHLAEGLRTAGGVRIVGARIGGRLTVRARFIGANHAGEALNADDLDVAGRVEIDDGGTPRPDPPDFRPDVPNSGPERSRTPHGAPRQRVRLAGRVSFADARMRGFRLADTVIGTGPDHGADLPGTPVPVGTTAGGDVPGDDASGSASGGDAAGGDVPDAAMSGTDLLVADRFQVQGDVSLGPGLDIHGAARFDGVQVDGTIIAGGVRLGRNRQRESLTLDHAVVSGHVQLDHRTEVAGSVRLFSAHVRGQVRLRGSRVTGPNDHGTALYADDLRCDGPMELTGDGERHLGLAGAVKLTRARLGGLEIRDAEVGGTATVPGSLSMEGAVVRGNVVLGEGVTVHGFVRLHGAAVHGQLRLRGCRVRGQDRWGNSVAAEAATITGDVLLDTGRGARFTAVGAIRLRRTEIGGDLSLRGADIRGADDQGYAVSASHVVVTGVVWMTAANGASRSAGPDATPRPGGHGGERGGSGGEPDGHGGGEGPGHGGEGGERRSGRLGLALAGAVRLADSRLGGLYLSGGTVDGVDARGYGLAAHAIQVASLVRLGPGLTLVGTASLFGAAMNQLTCDGVDLLTGLPAGPLAGRPGPVRPADSLVLDNAVVRGDVMCADGIRAHGPVRMFGATVGGRMVLDGLRIGVGTGGQPAPDGGGPEEAEPTDGEKPGASLVAEALRVTGDLSLVGLRTGHGVSLRGAEVGGTLTIAYAGIGPWLSLASARVALLRDLPAPPGTGEVAAMPEIDLVNLEYRYLSRASDRTVRHRRAWLRRPAGRFHSQPHEQLARTYLAEGDSVSASQILIDKHQRRIADLPRWRMRRLARRIFFVTAGHGYRPWLAGVWAVVVVLGFAGVVHLAGRADLMIQNRPAVVEAIPPGTPGGPTRLFTESTVERHGCDPRWPCLNPVGYAADVFFPGVSLGQDEVWRADTGERLGWWFRTAQWFVAALGWFLATIFVAAVAGVVRHQ